MKIYVDNDCEVYTEKTINEAIIDRIERWDYDGVYNYIVNHFCEADMFAMLPPDIQSTVFEYLKKEILDKAFYIHEIDESSLCDECPYKK